MERRERKRRREGDAQVGKNIVKQHSRVSSVRLCGHRARGRHYPNLHPTSLQSPCNMAQTSGKNIERVDSSIGWKGNILKKLAATWGKLPYLLPYLMT